MILAKAAWVQVIHADATVGAGTLVVQADGARRYQYNPRLQEIMREIPKGTIYDRNGLPLATSNWDELAKHRADYTALGIDLDRACPRSDSRYYPLGGVTFDLLGDLRTRLRWGATNTSFVERDSARRLRGYDDRPRCSKSRTRRPASWNEPCATTTVNCSRCCATAASRTTRRCARCSTGRATCACRSTRACKSRWRTSCATR